MFCSKCGATVADGAAFCPACGQPSGGVAGSAAASAYTSAPRVTYAGFWLRFVAFIIDAIIVGIATIPIRIGLMGAFGLRAGIFGRMGESPDVLIGTLLPVIMLSATISIVINWLYFAFTESSSWQATIGKKVLGLEVTDLEGRRISFARASGRFFGKIISGAILLIGYIMAGFTEKKQALHDIIAGTLVNKKV
ncbi:MAG: RDD family protein [Candidatus Acidiferrales bacterium]